MSRSTASKKEKEILIDDLEEIEMSFDGEKEENEPLLEDGRQDEPEHHSSKVCPVINRDYLAAKVFFFFFFSANGTLMPYLALFFKQLRLHASQVGIVSGMKPFIAFLLVPLWGYIADKTHKGNIIFIVSMIAYGGGYFSYSLAPAKHVCKITSNSTKHVMPPGGHGHHRRRIFLTPLSSRKQNDIVYRYNMTKIKPGNISKRDEIPWSLILSGNSHEIAFDEIDDVHVDVHSIFLYLLIITIFSTFLSCPALTLVDTVTVRMLKDKGEVHTYGKQRLWGAIGWGLTAFGVGAVLSTIPLCPGKNSEVNYYPAFYIFAALMLLALAAGIRLDFNQGKDINSPTRGPAKVVKGLVLLKNARYCMFMITAFYIGVTMAVIRTFLFWHLKDLGGTQLLFSIISALNCTSEVLMYFMSAIVIKKIGHVKVLYIGLVCYSIRLFYYAFLTNPWYVIAAEPLSGITTAAVWSSMTSYVGLYSSPDSSTTLQGLLHGIHWGLGHGCGELIGGFLVGAFGTNVTFAIFASGSLLNLFLYSLVNNVSPDLPRDYLGAKLDDSAEHETLHKPCCN